MACIITEKNIKYKNPKQIYLFSRIALMKGAKSND